MDLEVIIQRLFFRNNMKYYINSASSSKLELDHKELIPDANMRRRMSYVVRMGLGVAMDCIRNSSVEKVDGIVTAMGLGCLADSEKFLKNILDNNEQMLNPTPFIQSTFNTIGGQIALLTGNKCYNMTYSHRELSFESALLDCLMKLDEGDANNILVGAADEMTPTQVAIMQRMGIYKNGVGPSEGAHFFIVGNKPTNECIAVIDGFFMGDKMPTGTYDLKIKVEKGYFTASAEALWHGIAAIKDGSKRVLVENNDFKISLTCL